MRLTAAEKREVSRLGEGSALSVRRTLGELGVQRSTFYGLEHKPIGPDLPDDVHCRLRMVVADEALALVVLTETAEKAGQRGAVWSTRARQSRLQGNPAESTRGGRFDLSDV